MFSEIWNRQPKECTNGLKLFGADEDGDFFDEDDVLSWQKGRFAQNFASEKLIKNAASRRLIEEIVRKQEPYVDLACGPGMGLIPSIKKLCPEIPCMATDANAILIKEWSKWLRDSNISIGIELAQFSLFDIPLKERAVKAYGGFLGISSTRNGCKGYDKALSEIYRTLTSKGRLYVIESEWVDVPSIIKVFEKSGIRPWTCFMEEQVAWHERFIKCGFRILSEEIYENHKLNSNDNELGSAAERSGEKIEMLWKAYILEKP